MNEHTNASPEAVAARERRRMRDALAGIENERARRRGEVVKPRKKFKPKDARAVQEAFARAARESRELARLRATGEPWACLGFHPERLGPSFTEETQAPAAGADHYE